MKTQNERDAATVRFLKLVAKLRETQLRGNKHLVDAYLWMVSCDDYHVWYELMCSEDLRYEVNALLEQISRIHRAGESDFFFPYYPYYSSD